MKISNETYLRIAKEVTSTIKDRVITYEVNLMQEITTINLTMVLVPYFKGDILVDIKPIDMECNTRIVHREVKNNFRWEELKKVIFNR